MHDCVLYYSAASFANLRNASSQGGYMFLYKDEERFSPNLGNLKRFREL